MAVPPLLARHHEDWFAYRCANYGVSALTGATLKEASAVCTRINGTGFTEAIDALDSTSEAFDLAVTRIATAVLEMVDLQGERPERGPKRNSIVAGARVIKCNKLQAVAVLAADRLMRPVEGLFGTTLTGENDWHSEGDAEAWVRRTLSPDSPTYTAARDESRTAAEALRPTALFKLNDFMHRNESSSYTFPTSVVSEIAVSAAATILVESVTTPAVEVARAVGPHSFAVDAEWPAMVRVRSEEAVPIALTVV
jgi:hypothetical protein